ncbi:hypothetical protein ACEQ8H_006072 [Pleosporales sp. CAS-2024a]
MESTASQEPAIICAENVALLSVLHSVPNQPLRNAFNTSKQHTKDYILSFQDELTLTESLAYLANDADNVNHIPAVCIEQHAETSSLNILLAVNRLNEQSGKHSLQRLKKGFEEVFATLANVAHRGRGSPKQTIQQMLRNAIICFNRMNSKVNKAKEEASAVFIEKAKDVIKSADAWVKHQTSLQLEELVASVHHVKQAVDTETILRDFTSKDMDPSTRRSMVNIINKVARYCEVARFLYRMSKKKKSALVRSLRVTTISLPTTAFDRISTSSSSSSNLQSALSRTDLRYREADIKHVRKILHTANYHVEQQFADRVAETLAKSKVHAEIQLVYYIELKHSLLPPRVVASSKDACFLCNAFLAMHGRLYTARTHGRLYPGWRLPCIPSLGELERRFNTVLARQMETSLKNLLSRGKKTVYPDPNESTLLTLPYSASTIAGASTWAKHKLTPAAADCLEYPDAGFSIDNSTVLCMIQPPQMPLAAEQGGQDGDQLSARTQAQAPSTTPSCNQDQPCKYKRQKSYDRAHDDMAKTRDMVGVVSRSEVETRTTLASHAGGGGVVVKLIQGASLRIKRGNVLFQAAKLRLHMECPPPLQDLVQGGPVHTTESTVRGALEWLDDMEAQRISRSLHVDMIDVTHLTGEETYKADEQGCVYLGTRGTVVRLRLGNATYV